MINERRMKLTSTKKVGLLSESTMLSRHVSTIAQNGQSRQEGFLHVLHFHEFCSRCRFTCMHRGGGGAEGCLFGCKPAILTVDATKSFTLDL